MDLKAKDGVGSGELLEESIDHEVVDPLSSFSLSIKREISVCRAMVVMTSWLMNEIGVMGL